VGKLNGVQCGVSAIKSLYGCVFLAEGAVLRWLVCLSSLNILVYCVRFYVMYGILLFLFLLIVTACILCAAFVA